MRKIPPPVIIDNWPNPPIVLENIPSRPRRVCGVFVCYASPWSQWPQFWKGQYFSSTMKASAAVGFRTDKIGRMLRKAKGTYMEGLACVGTLHFITAKRAVEENNDVGLYGPLRYQFPWLYKDEDPAIRANLQKRLLEFSIELNRIDPNARIPVPDAPPPGPVWSRHG